MLCNVLKSSDPVPLPLTANSDLMIMNKSFTLLVFTSLIYIIYLFIIPIEICSISIVFNEIRIIKGSPNY